MRLKKPGFTLLEILIVLIILGIIASLTIPSYQGFVERSRSMEAFQRLKITRSALARYYAQHGTYTGATIPISGLPGTVDYNPNSTPIGGNLLFTYTLFGLSDSTYTLRATRNAWAGCATIGRIESDENGTLTATGAYIGIL